MNSLEAIFLGIVQGLTEFLPVSSSGHLVLAQALLDVRSEGILFEVVVHAATLVAVVVFYRKQILDLANGLLQREADAWRYALKLVVATVPAAAAALLAPEFFEGLYENVHVVALALLATGVMVWSIRRSIGAASQIEPGWWVAFLIGVAQAVALVPGVSRSGATVAVALALGIRPLAAAQFSFLMSGVAISGAVVLKLPELLATPASGLENLALGGAAALISGVFALTLFVRLLQAETFHRFAYYVWLVGALVLATSLLSPTG